MKKILNLTLCGLALCAMTACGSKSDQKTADSDSAAALDSIVSMVEAVNQTQDEAKIVASIREIYVMRPAVIYTPDFQKILDAVEKKDQGEMGFFDYDILTNSQDPGDLKSVDVVELIGNDAAKVKVSGDGYGENGYVIVITKLIDGSYLIDDVDGPDGKSVKAAAQTYLSEL